MLSLLQSLGTSPDCHNLSNMVESGLATLSASSLRTRGCISSGPMDLCTFRFLRQSRTWSSPTVGGSSFSQSPPSPSATWAVWVEHLLLKTYSPGCPCVDNWSKPSVSSCRDPLPGVLVKCEAHLWNWRGYKQLWLHWHYAPVWETCIASVLQNVITSYPSALAQNQGTTTALWRTVLHL